MTIEEGGRNNNGAAASQEANQRLLGQVPVWGDEAFEEHIFQFDNFCAINGIVDSERMVRLFLMDMRERGKKIKDGCSKLIKDLTMAEVKKKAAELYAPSSKKYRSRDVFHHREQQKGKTAAEFAAALKDLGEHCAWTAEEEKHNLVTQLVARVENRDVKKKLYVLAESKGFAELVDTVILEETPDGAAGGSGSRGAEVNKVKNDAAGNRKWSNKSEKKTGESTSNFNKNFNGKCSNCQAVGHKKVNCRCCYYCKKPGHRLADCRIKQKKEMDQKNRGVDFVDNNIADVSYSSKVKIQIVIAGAEIEFECDTGSVFTLVGSGVAKHWNKTCWRKPSLVLKSVTGHPLKLLGVMTHNVLCGGRRAELTL